MKFDIPHAAAYLQVSQQYVRMLIREKKIRSEMIPTHEGSTVMKHVIEQGELEAFASRDNRRAPRREDGRGKCCFYSTAEELLRIKELLYATHDAGLAIVAESMTANSKGASHVSWVPPSKQNSTRE